ncbi:MAG: hypothetical protein KGO82_05255 [Bacteroidota bacterium]|nr:hypothetical protein [Bacteroidota bacterium]
MKNAWLFCLALCLAITGYSQGVFSNQTNFILEKVVQEYSTQFAGIKGKPLPAAADPSFASTLSIPGAISTTIIESTQKEKPAHCWQSVLFANDNFGTASAKFETLFNQIRNTIIKPVDEKPVIVNGLFVRPSQDKLWTTIQFDMLPPSGIAQKLNIDLVLYHRQTQWEIILTVYDKERTANGALAVSP